MSGDNLRIDVAVVTTADMKSVEKTTEQISSAVKYKLKSLDDELKIGIKNIDKFRNTKRIKNDGYAKLSSTITKARYPEQIRGRDGILRGADYSKLQKAQDKLIDSWNKLSDKGFYSNTSNVVDTLRAYKDYKRAVDTFFKENRSKSESDDKVVMAIKREIGAPLHKYFSRLVDVPSENGRKRTLTDISTDREFNDYVYQAVRRHKAAGYAGIDLSKQSLTKEDKSTIKLADTIKAVRSAAANKLLTRKYEYQHADELLAAQQELYAKILKEREETHRNAVKIDNSGRAPVDDVVLTSTKVPKLAKHTGYERTREDEKEDRKFIKGINSASYARKSNTPGYDTNLDIRRQVWNPTYVMEEMLRKMERNGTYFDTNSLLRQTFQYLPKAIKKAMEDLTVKIDKDLANEKFTKFDKSEKAELEKVANEIGMEKLLLTNVAKVQGALMAGRPDVTSADLVNSISVALADAVEHGKSAIAYENYKKAVLSINNMLMNRYSNMKDSIGSNVRRHKGSKKKGTDYMEEELGVGKNYEEVAATLKDVFKEFEKSLDVLLDRAIKEFPEFYGGDSTSSNVEKKKKNTTFNQVYNEKLQQLSGELNQIAAVLNNIMNHDLVESSTEEIANAKLIKGNQEEINVIKHNDTTGFDSDENSTTVIGQQNTANRLAGEMKDTLVEIFHMIADALAPKEKGKHDGRR